MTAPQFRSSASTHVGKVRRENQDRFVDRPDIGLWAVADGAGGHADGAHAAQLVADTLDSIPDGFSTTELLAQVRLRIAAVHNALRDQAKQRGPDTLMASTVVMLLARDDHYACLWAGDSRAYLLRDGALSQLNRDHSLVQELVDAGAISPEEAETHPHANVITRAIGGDVDDLLLDKVTGRLQVGDRFLICSDGLTKMVDDVRIEVLLATETDAPLADLLIEKTLEGTARDNVTVVTIEVLKSDERLEGY